MEALEVVVWTHETSVKEGKGSRGSKVGTNPNNNMEGSRPVLILPHQPGRSPKFSKVLKNSWKLRSDQDGGSGGHHSGQRRVQVREKATGDLLIFVFVKSSP